MKTTHALALAACAAINAAALADTTVDFTKLVATGDLVAGTTDAHYTGLSRATASDGNFAWRGTAAGATGIYARINGVDTVIAQTGMVVPNSGGQTFVDGHFTNSLGKIDGDDVAFRAGGWIFASFNGAPIQTIATTGTVNPASGLVYDSLQQPYISNGEIAFTNGALGANASSTVWSNGTLTTLVSTTTALPSPMNGNLTLISQSEYSNGTLAMQVFDASFKQGILTNRGGNLEMIAHGYQNVPGQTFAFGQFLDPVIDGDNIAFIAWGTGDGAAYRGVFLDDGTGLSTVVDTNTAAPTGGLFTDFARGPSLFGDTMLFSAGVDGASSLSGVYALYNGEIIVIADTTTDLDGRTAVSFDLDQHSLYAADKGTFLANFADGSQAIYTFSIPAPGTLALLALGAAPVTRRRRLA